MDLVDYYTAQGVWNAVATNQIGNESPSRLCQYGVIEVGMASGRARCRICGHRIAQGSPVARFAYDFHGSGSYTTTIASFHTTFCYFSESWRSSYRATSFARLEDNLKATGLELLYDGQTLLLSHRDVIEIHIPYCANAIEALLVAYTLRKKYSECTGQYEKWQNRFARGATDRQLFLLAEAIRFGKNLPWASAQLLEGFYHAA